MLVRFSIYHPDSNTDTIHRSPLSQGSHRNIISQLGSCSFWTLRPVKFSIQTSIFQQYVSNWAKSTLIDPYPIPSSRRTSRIYTND